MNSNRPGDAGGAALASQTLVERVVANARVRGDALALQWLEHGHVEADRYGFAALDRRARALSVSLREAAASRGRDADTGAAVIATEPGLDFAVAFLACLYAGVAAVPAHPPRRREGTERLRLILADSGAFAILGDRETFPAYDACPELSRVAVVLDAGTVDERRAEDWRYPAIGPATTAFVQYTSGSTDRPKGVVVSHGNLMANLRMIQCAMGHDQRTVLVGWLPLFHDMGLIGNLLQSLYLGVPCILMAPAAFVAQPIRWLQAIDRYRGTTSGGPNFAYDLCVLKTRPEQREGLDLSSWRVAFNGAEPIRASTLARFGKTFAPHGFDPAAQYPCYGMAEATLIISGKALSEAPSTALVDKSALEAHRVEIVEGDRADGVRLVGSGRPCVDTHVRIVDPDTCLPTATERVGEIWVHGPAVAREYRNQAELSERTFRARLADGSDQREYLRTGDLGFMRDGELFVTGRSKDLIIVAGRNHYPQDIEASATRAHPALQASLAAAFAVEHDDGEALVVAIGVKIDPDRPPPPLAEMLVAVQRAISHEHALSAHDIVLTDARIPITSSGKIQRRATARLYRENRLPVLIGLHREPSQSKSQATVGAAP